MVNNRTSTYKKIFLLLFVLLALFDKSYALTADFVSDVQQGCAPQLVHFTDKSGGSPISWSWDLGAGNTSSLQNPSIIYTKPGTYTIKLTVSDGKSSNTITKTSYIQVFDVPVLDFTVDKKTDCQNTVFTFTDKSVAGSSKSSITAWSWDFGDGGSSSSQNPPHTFQNAGSFDIVLTAKDANGCSASQKQNGLVTIKDNPLPVFTADKKSSCVAPLTVNFSNQTKGSGTLNYKWDFGDGDTSIAASPAHVYKNPGSYNVKLLVSGSNGCNGVLSMASYINIGNRKIDFSASPTAACVNKDISFAPVGITGAVSYWWDFDDGNTYDSATVKHQYSSPGTYSPSLVISYGDGCTDTFKKTDYITIDNPPLATFRYTPQVSCNTPFNVTFTNLSPNTTAYWDFGDGGTSTKNTPIHQYSTQGPFAVKLAVSSAGGCVDTLLDSISFMPLVTVTSSPRQTCGTSATVSFSSTNSLGTPGSYSWNFGDGGTSTLAKPTHPYTNEGTFFVTVKLKYANGCTITGYDTIDIHSKPIPDFSASPTRNCVNRNVKFTNKSTNATRYQWNFGRFPHDTIDDVNPTVQYYKSDTLDVTLIAFNGACSDTITFKQYIKIMAPTAKILIADTLLCTTLPATVKFIDSSIYTKKPHLNRLWNFGDPASGVLNTSTDSVPMHKFTKYGKYTVTIHVYDSISKCDDNATKVISIQAPYNIVMGATVRKGCAPLAVTFIDSSANSVKWFWDFGDAGDGDTDVVKAPIYTYYKPGKYTVMLKVKNKVGCTANKTFTNYIEARGPQANFSISGKICPPYAVSFKDASTVTSALKTYKWNFGDPASGLNNSSTIANPTRTFSAKGNYVVVLTVTDNEGCSNTTARIINYGPPVPQFSVDRQIVCKNLPVIFKNLTQGSNQYLWSFSDSTSKQVNPVHHWGDTGLYSVKLIATRADGCLDSLVQKKYISVVKPRVNFKANKTKGLCPPFTVNFKDSVSSDINSWRWDFGDSTYSTLPNPVHTYYSKPGKYTVRLWVGSAGGCSDSVFKTNYIEVGGPTGTFDFSPKAVCSGQPMIFRATSPTATLYTWDFGNGDVLNSASDTMVYTYKGNGVFHPRIILTDSNYCSLFYNSTDSARIFTSPLAAIKASTTHPCKGQGVIFNDSIKTKQTLTYTWLLSDTTVLHGNYVTHAFSHAGDFDVKLIVTDSIGCLDSLTKMAYIHISPAPVVQLSPDTLICQGDTAHLLASGGTRYHWSPQQGLSDTAIANPIANPSASTTYTVRVSFADRCNYTDKSMKVNINPLPTADAGPDVKICKGDSIQLHGSGGVYHSWLPSYGLWQTNTSSPYVTPVQTNTYHFIVKDALGCVGKDSVTVEVIKPVKAAINGPNAVCYGAVVRLQASSGQSYTWNSGDTGRQILVKIIHDTTFIVTPYTGGCKGEPDTIKIIVASKLLTADFSYHPDTLFATQKIHFENKSKGAKKFAWYFDTGLRDTSTAENPVYAYRRSGLYPVRLIIKNEYGCSDTVIKPVNVLDDHLYIPTIITPNGDDLNDYLQLYYTYPYRLDLFQIYNRWGQMIFESKDIRMHWDGTYKGAEVPEGVYMYTLSATKDNGERYFKSGTITVIR